MLRLIASLGRDDTSARTVRLHLLVQNSRADQRAASFPEFVRVSDIDASVSLSAARNHLLGGVQTSAPFEDDDVVGFPDDDAWYPPGLLDRVASVFASIPDLDFWFCRYASTPVPVVMRHAPPDLAPGVRDVVRNASSNTIFVRGSLARSLRFDETLGVGTATGSAEDTDYAVRACLAGRRTRFADAAFVGHHDKDLACRARYFPGEVLVIARHARRVPALRRELIRKVGVGAYLGLRGVLPFGVLGSSLYRPLGISRRADRERLVRHDRGG